MQKKKKKMTVLVAPHPHWRLSVTGYLSLSCHGCALSLSLSRTRLLSSTLAVSRVFPFLDIRATRCHSAVSFLLALRCRSSPLSSHLLSFSLSLSVRPSVRPSRRTREEPELSWRCVSLCKAPVMLSHDEASDPFQSLSPSHARVTKQKQTTKKSF